MFFVFGAAHRFICRNKKYNQFKVRGTDSNIWTLVENRITGIKTLLILFSLKCTMRFQTAMCYLEPQCAIWNQNRCNAAQKILCIEFFRVICVIRSLKNITESVPRTSIYPIILYSTNESQLRCSIISKLLYFICFSGAAHRDICWNKKYNPSGCTGSVRSFFIHYILKCNAEKLFLSVKINFHQNTAKLC